MSKKIYYYPVWVRLWHMINALMFLILIITGFSIQYANSSPYFVRFDIAITIHDVAGIILTINYLLFLFGNALTDNGKFYHLTVEGGLDRIKKQLHYYSYGIFKKEKVPFPINETRKFNPLQKLTYVISMYLMVPVMIFTGIALFFPVLFDFLGITSLIIADWIHILLGYFLSIFMIIHVYFCTIGHSVIANFKSMINGYHEVHE